MLYQPITESTIRALGQANKSKFKTLEKQLNRMKLINEDVGKTYF